MDSQTKKCPFCKEQINIKAKKCPHCQSEIPHHSWVGVLVSLLLIAFGFYACGSCLRNTSETYSSASYTKTSSSPSSLPTNAENNINSNWQFSENTDSFDNKTRKHCLTSAVDQIKGVVGYSTPMLDIRKTNNNSPEVIIQAKGVVFRSNIMDDEIVRLKFDDEAPMKVGYSESNNGSSDTLFLHHSSKIISKLKTAQRLVVEYPVAFESNVRSTFIVSGYNETCIFEPKPKNKTKNNTTKDKDKDKKKQKETK